jgi:hypothetical protein
MSLVQSEVNGFYIIWKNKIHEIYAQMNGKIHFTHIQYCSFELTPKLYLSLSGWTVDELMYNFALWSFDRSSNLYNNEDTLVALSPTGGWTPCWPT